MPRTPAVSRFGADIDSQAAITEVVDFLATHPGVRLVSQDGIERVLPHEMAVVLRRAGEILRQGHEVDVLDASSDTLTPNEAADLIGISRPTLLKLIDEGLLSAPNIPGSAHRRLDRMEVEAFRDSRLRMQSGLNDAATEARATGLFTRRPRKVQGPKPH
jgi:excisionase family DNA binding protein